MAIDIQHRLGSATELTSITNDYFALDGGKAWDIYFTDSYGLNYFGKQKKGLYEKVPGGAYFQVPLEFGGLMGVAYPRGTISINRTHSGYNKQIIKNARYSPTHYMGSAKVLRVDKLANRDKFAMVKDVVARVKNAQKTLVRKQSTDFHGYGGTANVDTINGTFEFCYNGDVSRTYPDANIGNLANTETGWTGRLTDRGAATATLDDVRQMRLTAKVRDGKNGRPDIVFCSPAIFAVFQDILQSQQRFVEDKDAAAAGFQSISLEGCTIIEDDFVNSSDVTNHAMVAINSAYYGIHCYEGAEYDKTDWTTEEATPGDMFMDIYWDGQVVSSMRDAHIGYHNVGV